MNNLSNRMSTLENSLDAKIDSLVSSYLSRNGIWNGEKQEKISDTDFLYTNLADSSWIGKTVQGSFEYNYTPKQMFKPSTKAGLLVINAEWGLGTYFSDKNVTKKNNSGYCRIYKTGNLSDETFGGDIQFGVIDKDNVFKTYSSMTLSAQYRGVTTFNASNILEDNAFSFGTQVHFGAVSFFILKDDKVGFRVSAYGTKYATNSAWPNQTGTAHVGIRNFSGQVY